MATKKKLIDPKPEGFIALLIVCSTMLASIAIIFGPICLFVLWFVNYQDKKHFINATYFNQKEGFVLSPVERELLEKTEKQQKSLRRVINQINELGSDLARKQNGYFYNNSKQGRELNPKLFMVSQMMQNEQQMLDRLASLPHLRAKAWAKISTMETALIESSLAYVVVLFSSLWFFNDWVFASISGVLVMGAVMFMRFHRHYLKGGNTTIRESKIFEQ